MVVVKKKLCFGEALLSGYTEPTSQVAHPIPILPCHIDTVGTDWATPTPDILFVVGFSMYIARMLKAEVESTGKKRAGISEFRIKF